MNNMFQSASAFTNNGSETIGNWNTSNVTNMNNMFNSATLFNQNISGWNVSLVSPKPPTDFRTNCPLTDPNTPPAFL
jgi:hypothetical protein